MLESIIIIVGILLDRLTKLWAAGPLKAVGSMDFIPGIMEFHYVENRGAAFSMLWGKTWIFIILTLLIVAFLIGYLLKYRNTDGIWMRIAVSSIIAGAIGNLIDRLLYGYVVDFLRPTFINFAVFNIANIFVTCGAILFIIVLLFFNKREKEMP